MPASSRSCDTHPERPGLTEIIRMRFISSRHLRQRLLRSAYVAACYDWPETLASEWKRRPERFERAEPSCRASRFLEAMISG